MTKLTEGQVVALKKHLADGKTVTQVAWEMYPDVSYQMVQYYKKKFREIEGME